MARIDTPRPEAFYIAFFNQIVFNTPKTMQFISHTPPLGARVEARLAFRNEVAEVRHSSHASTFGQILVKSHAKSLIGKFRRWSKSVPRDELRGKGLNSLYCREKQQHHIYAAARIESSINHTIWEASGARTQAVSCSMLI